MVVFTRLMRIIILAFHVHLLITAHMTDSEDKHWLPKISQPEMEPCFLFGLFSSLGSLILFQN